jgi:alpha-beta hydrolase superfamily lysophospholipase
LKDWISSDNDNVDNYVEDPLCGFPVTNGLWDDLANGLLEVFKKEKYPKSNNSTSIFIISGSDDPVGENGKGVYRLNTFISSLYSNTSIKIEEGARHEVFSEYSKENSYNSLIKFITTI